MQCNRPQETLQTGMTNSQSTHSKETIFLHVNNKTFKALCQVTNADDCLLMGRALAKTMGYIDYPDIKPPTKIKQNTQTNIKAVQAETNNLDTESASEPR